MAETYTDADGDERYRAPMLGEARVEITRDRCPQEGIGASVPAR